MFLRFRTFVQWLTNNKRKQKTKTKELMTKEEQMYREERQLKAIVKCNLMTTDCVTTGTLARRLKMKASELYRKLKERKILYHSDGMWMHTRVLGCCATATPYIIRCWERRSSAYILCGRRVVWSS